MNNKRVFLAILYSIIFFGHSSLSYGGIDDQVDDWWDNMEYSNITSPGVFEGQTARYATFGGISTRAKVTQVFKFVDIQTPKFSAGWGGIDFYSGGFSAIDADQFIDNLRAIGQNAQSLAFMLGIQIVSPQLNGVMKDINAMAQKLNALNMSSCEAATKLVGGTMNMFGADEGNCTVKRMADFGEDWTEANHNCTTGGEKANTDASGDSPNLITFTKGNLAWSVLMEDPLFANDLAFAELILNITGTIIIASAGNGDDSENEVRTIFPSIDSNGNLTERGNNIYTALLKGNEAAEKISLFLCDANRNNDPDGCTHMTDEHQNIDIDWQGLTESVRNEISEIVVKIYDDEELSDTQKGIIVDSKFPLYKYLVATAAYFPKSFDISSVTSDYNDLIAEDILLRNITAVIETVRQSVSSMPNNMGSSESVKTYVAGLNDVLKGFHQRKQDNKFNMDRYIAMEKRIETYERALMSRLSSGMVQSATWSK